MIVELIKDYRHDYGKVFKKGISLNIHPSDLKFFIKKKLIVNKQLIIKENGDNGDN